MTNTRESGTLSFCEKEEVHHVLSLLAQLSHQLTKQPFNVIANKRLKKTKPIVTEAKNTLNPFRSEQDEKDIVQLTHLSSQQIQKSSTKLSELVQIAKTSNVRFNTFQTHFSHSKEKHPLKMNQTVTVKTSKESPRGTKKGSSSMGISQSEDEVKRGKGQRRGREYSQGAEREQSLGADFAQSGPLKEKHLMNWLNQILIEYCFEQELEKGQLKALQRFGLDQNSLLSRGMTIHSCSRLFKMLFVYSMGFNNQLKELGCSQSTLKSIWKVYAVLLEYCSAGKFETMMGEIERDTMKNEQRLLREIQTRQMQIDNTEEIMEERLHRYIKDNKELKTKVKALQEKCDVLEKEFREMEMAYNMEVTLRLAYQYKINEIYSVHEKLNILHLNLYKELQEKTAESSKMAAECWQAKQTAGELKADKEQIAGYLLDLKHALALQSSLVEGLRMNEQQLTEKLFEEASAKREEVVELREREKRIGQLQRQVGSSNLMVNIMKSAADSHLQEYRRLMLENSDLRMLNQAQLEKISEQLSDIKYLNNKESTLKGQLNHATIKIAELSARIAAQDSTIDDLTKQLQRKEVEHRTKCIEFDSQVKMVQSVDRNMKEMKALYQRLEEDLQLSKKYASQMALQHEQAHNRLMVLELEVKALQEQKFQLELDVNRKQSDIISLRKKCQADADLQQRQYQKLHKLWSGKEQEQALLNQQLTAARTELETANIRISFLSQQFTDLTFEKSKIEALYHDNLVLHDREKNAQKGLMIQMSTLRDQLEESHRQLELTRKTSQQNIDRLSKQKAELQKILQAKERELRKKQGFVHPMLLEDALETLRREIEGHYSTRIGLQNEVEKQTEKNQSLQLELQRKEADFRQHVKELERRAEKAKAEIENQREYFKGKSEQLNTLIFNLETQLTSRAAEADRQQDAAAEAKLAELVKAKNTQIQELLGQLQRIEDSYQQKCSHYQGEIDHIHAQKQAAITQLKDSKRQLQAKVIEIERTYQEKLLQKERQKEEMVQRLMEQRAITEAPQQEEQEEEEKPAGHNNKRKEFMARLKFANAYYHR